jgi:hypothetical protein
MKKINCNGWAPRNKRAPYEWAPYIPITNPPLVRVDNLYYSFYWGVFYYILERVVSYNILDKNNYFYEDD